MRILISVLNTIDNISEWTGRVAAFLIPLVVLAMSYEVVARYGFNAPTKWSYEVSYFLAGTAMIIGGAYALRHAAHVNVDIAYSRFPLRGKAILDVVSSVLFFAFVGVLVWKGWGFALKSLKFLENSDSLWSPPLYPFKVALFVGACLITLQGLAKLIRDLTMIITGKQEIIKEEDIARRGETV